MPSITPTVNALAPSTETMNSGNRLWIISDETSISRLTKPSTHTPRGISVNAFLAILVIVRLSPDGSVAAFAGWVEHSDTQRSIRQHQMMGIAEPVLR